MKQEYTRETLLTTVDALRHKLGAPDLCIIDVRPAEDYAKGHIPGATHFDLFGLSLIDTSEAPLKAFMFMIHHVLELRGVSETKQVVFYEANSGMRAARGVWFLEYYGHPNVKMLDGGFAAWKAAGAPVTSEATAPKAAAFKSIERPEVLATAEDVLRSLNKRESSSSTPVAAVNSWALMYAPLAAAQYRAQFTSSGPTTSRRTESSSRMASSKRCTRKPASHRIRKLFLTVKAAIAPRTAMLLSGYSGFRRSATTSVHGRNGATAPICRWRSPNNDSVTNHTGLEEHEASDKIPQIFVTSFVGSKSGRVASVRHSRVPLVGIQAKFGLDPRLKGVTTRYRGPISGSVSAT